MKFIGSPLHTPAPTASDLPAHSLHGPHADGTVGVASEEGVAIGGPAHRDARDLDGLGAHGGDVVRDELRDNVLGLEVPDLHRGVGRRAQPVAVGGEEQRVDRVARLPFTQVNFGLGFRTRRQKWLIRGTNLRKTRTASSGLGKKSSELIVSPVCHIQKLTSGWIQQWIAEQVGKSGRFMVHISEDP